MRQNESADVRGGNLETPATPTSGVVVPFQRTTSSVGPRSASSNPNHRNSGQFLDTRAALRALSAARFNVEASVYAELAAMASKHGEAWPRMQFLAERTGIDRRLLRLAIGRLEERGMLSTRRLEVGSVLPSGSRVAGNPLRVFRVLTPMPQKGGSIDPPVILRSSGSIDPPVIDRSSGEGIDRSHEEGIDRSSTPYEGSIQEDFLPTTTIDKTVEHSASGVVAAPGAPPPPEPTPPGIESEREDASRGAPEGAPVTFTSSQAASETRLASAPLERAMCTRTRSRADCTDVADGGHKGGGASGAPASSPRMDARRVLVRWAELVAPHGVVVAPLHTPRRLNAVCDRLRDGFAADELVELVTHAVTSRWHLQQPTRLEARFLFRTAEDVAGVLHDARLRRRGAGAKRAGKTSGGPPTPPHCSDAQRSKSEPRIRREPTFTGAADVVAALDAAGARNGGAK